jgi:folylpolyglutamate synthase/dihydropteroate synthase
VEHLVQWLREQAYLPAIALFAALSDKDVHAMIRACEGVFQRWWVPALPGVARAMPAQTLARQMMDSGARNVTPCQSVADAWGRLQDSAEDGLVVVFGSFHTVSAFMALQELTT